ncbi:dipeptidyl aminopeptidase/acylaminoacyl peptidase [Oxalobacteraceae bacterium GrIS 2.11]
MRHLLLTVFYCLLVSSHAAVARDNPGPLLPVESFFKNASFSGAAMSPDGQFVALRISNNESRALLAVLDLNTMKSVPVAAFRDADIGYFSWVNDQRLVFSLTDLHAAQANVYGAPGLFAVNRDGSKFRQLVERFHQIVTRGGDPVYLPWNSFLIGTTTNQESDDVWVKHWQSRGSTGDEQWQLQRLNTLNSAVTEVDTPAYSTDWVIDQSNTPRVAVVNKEGRVYVQYNDPLTSQWRTLVEYANLDKTGFYPIGLGSSNMLYVRARNQTDKEAVYRFDLEHNKLLPEPIIKATDYDVRGGVIIRDEKLIGVRFLMDAEATVWLDKGMAAIQEKVDAILPNTVNRILSGSRPVTPFVVIEASSDVQPQAYYLYNSATQKMINLGKSRPDVHADQMAHMKLLQYQARDGLTIPAYLTLPNVSTQKNLPMVVLVHGGPYIRTNSWVWQADVQFLASRGYAVLQPEFRGTPGYGAKLFNAGIKQWGLAMQNDIADGARWAIAQGIADPRRICIAGASYGGYSTLMGLINDPELYRCGIDWVGVTDINLMYTATWGDASTAQKKYSMPVFIGDPEKDAAQLKATSPIEQADRIKQPLLLAYGSADTRVPLVHGEKFYEAVKKGNPDVEWVVYEGEGHGFALLKNRVDFWTRAEKFLDRNIGEK